MSATKESSPVSSAAAAADKPAFSEREMKLIIAAMMSLKSGPPDVDYQRFQKNGEFNTLKTAQNTWSTLKKKIASLNPEAAADAAASGKCCASLRANVTAVTNNVTATPKPKATPKKRAKADDGDEGAAEGEVSPTKKPKATPRKKKEPAAEGADGEDESASPKKKARKSPTKKAAAKKAEPTADEQAADDAAIEAEAEADVKATAAANSDEGDVAPTTEVEAEGEKTEDVKMEGQ